MPSIAATPLEVLSTRLGADWPAITRARQETDRLREKLRSALAGARIDDSSCSIVVSGSLGRREANEESDVDWFLLIDGPSSPDHARMAREIKECIATAGFKDVGPTGTFGTIVASHGLVHHIAGTSDSNENLTRRMLLLAESWAISGAVVRERVIRNVLARYVRHDRSVQSTAEKRQLVPHFLLNDVVRYWRTVASDYASKVWERDGKGWATRNVKLRFSRKLLFVWGMLASFAATLFPPTIPDDLLDEDALALLSDRIREQTDVTPLDLLASVVAHGSVRAETANRIFSAYDLFLSKMSEPGVRAHLDRLPFQDAASDPLYNELREKSHEFHDGLACVFFDEHPPLKELVRQFGVF